MKFPNLPLSTGSRSRLPVPLVQGLAGLALAGGLAVTVVAQTASDVTPPSFRPDLTRLGGAVVFSGEPGLIAPEGADQLSITLSGVTVEGGMPQMRAAHETLRERLVAGPIPIDEIFVAARSLEAAYAREGFVLSRVVLPAQTLRDGDELRLVVVNGFVERIDVGGVAPQVRERVETLVAPLLRRPGLTLDEIERRLLLAGDTPGTALRSALGAGAEPGGTVLAISSEFKPVTGFFGVNNSLSDELGTWTATAGIEANSPLGRGETFYFRVYGNPFSEEVSGRGGFFSEDPRVRTLAAGVVYPIGIDGLTFNLEATHSLTNPEAVGGLATASEFRRLSFRVDYPWIRSRSLNLNAQLSFDVQAEDLTLITPTDEFALSEDDIRVLRVGIDGSQFFDSGALIEAGATASFGLDAFGARGADDATDELPLSRDGADAEFQKVELAASYNRPVREHLAFSIAARAQTSFGQPLVESEQFGIASFREFSSFDAGSISGDSGWVVRGEVLSPWTVTTARWPLQVTPYAFAAAGAVHLEQPTDLEEETLDVSAFGVGVDLDALLDPAFSRASLAVEYSRGFRSDDLDEDRISLVGSVRF